MTIANAVRLGLAPTAKKLIVAIRMFFLADEERHSSHESGREVKTPRFSRKEGKTPAFARDKVRLVLDSMPCFSLLGFGRSRKNSVHKF
jgi:hypothetical protein